MEAERKFKRPKPSLLKRSDAPEKSAPASRHEKQALRRAALAKTREVTASAGELVVIE